MPKFPPPRKKVQPKPSGLNTWTLPAGMVHHKVRNVIIYSGVEYVCVNVNSCAARFQCISGGFKFVKVGTDKFGEDEFKSESAQRLLSISNSCEPGFIVRVMPEDEFNNFLSRRTQAGRDKQKNNRALISPAGEEKEQVNMKAKSSKKATSKTSAGRITGAAAYMRQLFTDGVSKAEATKKLIAKFPKFEHDAAGVESRWRTAERIASHAEGRATAKPAKATKGGKTPPARKPAKQAPARKSAPSKKAAAAVPPPPPRSTPPPRPSSPEPAV